MTIFIGDYPDEESDGIKEILERVLSDIPDYVTYIIDTTKSFYVEVVDGQLKTGYE